MSDPLGLPHGAFAKIDGDEDELFYEEPRLVYHIDDNAVAALTGFYRAVLPEGGVLLDLMSSWVSHLPPETPYAAVIGHGMNAAELAANPRLSPLVCPEPQPRPVPAAGRCQRRRGDDLRLGAISGAARRAAARGRARVLRPGGPVVISFSNRCFWTKAVAIWRALGDDGHAALVERYLRHAGFERIETHRLAEWVEDQSRIR